MINSNYPNSDMGMYVYIYIYIYIYRERERERAHTHTQISSNLSTAGPRYNTVVLVHNMSTVL